MLLSSWRFVAHSRLVALALLVMALLLGCSAKPSTSCAQAAAHLSECKGSPVTLSVSATDEQCQSVLTTPCTDRAIMDWVGGVVGDTLCQKFGIDCTDNGHCEGSPAACSAFGDYSSCNGHSGCRAWMEYPPGADEDEMQFYPESTWIFRECMGTPTSCSSLGSQSACQVQQGCSWVSVMEGSGERCTTAFGDGNMCTVENGDESSVPPADESSVPPSDESSSPAMEDPTAENPYGDGAEEFADWWNGEDEGGDGAEEFADWWNGEDEGGDGSE